MRRSACPKSSEHGISAMFCADAALGAAVRRIFGPVVVAQLDNPAIQELSANYDPAARVCRLFVDDGSGPMRSLKATLSPAAIITAIRILATLDGQSLQPAGPFLNCILANGFRYHAALPPISDESARQCEATTITIRPGYNFRILVTRDLVFSGPYPQ